MESTTVTKVETSAIVATPILNEKLFFFCVAYTLPITVSNELHRDLSS